MCEVSQRGIEGAGEDWTALDASSQSRVLAEAQVRRSQPLALAPRRGGGDVARKAAGRAFCFRATGASALPQVVAVWSRDVDALGK